MTCGAMVFLHSHHSGKSTKRNQLLVAGLQQRHRRSWSSSPAMATPSRGGEEVGSSALAGGAASGGGGTSTRGRGGGWFMHAAALLAWSRHALGTVGHRALTVEVAACCSLRAAVAACAELRGTASACFPGRSGSRAPPPLLPLLGGRGQARRRLCPSCESSAPLAPLGGRGRARAACRRFFGGGAQNLVLFSNAMQFFLLFTLCYESH